VKYDLLTTDRTRESLPVDHGSLSATQTFPLIAIPQGRRLRVVGFYIVNPTGLAANGANFFAISVRKNASAILASHSTATDAIAAGVWIEPTLTLTDTDLVLNSGDVLDVTMTRTGTATLPPGRVVVHCLWVR
jgi:hypothetical protein